MAPWLPRIQWFEIDDQPWWPPFFRQRVQDTLAHTWNTCLPFQPNSPATIAALLLIREFGASLSRYTFIDFCAGAGGPTPAMERTVNQYLRARNEPEVDFVLTDIHPNVSAWDRLAKKSSRFSYEPQSVDAGEAPAHLFNRGDGKGVIRLFNLAFHHFDDALAKRVLKNTVETSEGFAIFELQDRSLYGFLATSLLPFGVIAAAPYYSWKWASPATFFFCCVIPILPLVLVWDGYISALRTRTPEEVAKLLHNCGADASDWEMKSGYELFLWPFAYMNYIICQPKRNKK